MNRQITEAPTSDSAIGMKISDFAVRSSRAPSARTAIASPSPVEKNVTTTTHHRLLMMVPRSAVKTANARSSPPPSSGNMLELPSSTTRPVWAFPFTPKMTKNTNITSPMTKSRLVKMSFQPVRSRLFSSLNTVV